jgi:sulfide:quinone oxidoreductase
MVGEHSMPPAGLPTAGIPVHFASEYAAQQIVGEITGAPIATGFPRTLTCVGYYGTRSGLAGTCEARLDEKQGRWSLSCYLTAVNPLVKLMKEAFYKAWIAALK